MSDAPPIYSAGPTEPSLRVARVCVLCTDVAHVGVLQSSLSSVRPVCMPSLFTHVYIQTLSEVKMKCPKDARAKCT